jgi:radical SAM protein with 4Fe4S-binding SPASM domain
MDFESFPYVVGWELTLGCNLRCVHCASSAGKERNRELTLAESLMICDQFPELFVEEVIFTGGEPLLNDCWDELAAHLHRLKIKSGMVTNGLLLTERNVTRMLSSGMMAIGVSIDGPEHYHNKLRCVPGAFTAAMQGIAAAVERQIRVTIITSITGENIDHLDETYGIVASSGAWKWQLQPLFPLGRGKEDKTLGLTEDQFIQLGEFIFEKRPKAVKSGLQIIPADSCGYFSRLDLPELGWKGCSAGRFSCGIMSDGRVKGCLSWPDGTVEGSLRDKSFWDIWFGRNAFIKQRHFGASEMNGYCRDCSVAIECGGGCQAMSLAMTGLFHSDPFCYKRILEKSSSNGSI